MISGKQLHGLRVYDKEGHHLGIVQDMVADGKTGAIKGFIISSTGLLCRTAFVPAQRVISLDIYGMVIGSREDLQKGQVKRGWAGEIHLGELTSQKGHVTDVWLEKDRIEAAELSQGLLSDIRSGRQLYPWDEL